MPRQSCSETRRWCHARYALAVAGAKDGIWDWDLVTHKVFYSARWKAMIGEPGVITEGVESQAQEDFLRQMGCDSVQGYLYSRPLTAEQLVEFARHGGRPHEGRANAAA